MDKNINGLYDNDYFACYLNVLKNTFKMKRYKQLPKVLGVFIAIFLIPFLIMGLLLTLPLYFFGFIFRVTRYPVEFLRGIVHGEGQEVKAAAQFIIYFISWPLIFLCYSFIALLTIIISLIFLVFQLVCYIWSLAGFEFTALPLDVDRELDISATRTTSMLVLSIILLILAIIFVLLAIVSMIIGLGPVGLAFYFSILVPYVVIGFTIQREKTKTRKLIKIIKKK